MKTRYVSCSCNCTSYCVDWGNNGLICYGTCNAIAIYKPSTPIGHITHTLHQHSDRVNTVQWIRPENGIPETELLSGSADGNVFIWSKDLEDNTFRVTSILNVGSKVAFVDSLQLSNDDISSNTSTVPNLLICTGSINGELKLWSRKKNANIKITQTISFERKLLICCRLAQLPNTKHPLLAIALEDASVSLYAGKSDVLELEFVRVTSLFGHEDWVRCIDFSYDSNGNVFLATGSQDNMIRLWKISGAVTESSTDELSLERHIFKVHNKEYNIILESILCGHEGWIYGIHWQPMKEKSNDNCQAMRLLSSSMDKSMIIWEFDNSTGIWVEKIRVGKVGGNSSGFYGCKFDPDGLHILAYGYQGTFHIWKYFQEIERWNPQSTPGGHFSEVSDLCWDPLGRFLITASTDQTTRIHAPWKDDLKELWHEIARPQIHGYDMTCLIMLAPHMYASGAEEKVVRVFTATLTFKNHLRLLANVEDFKSITALDATVPSLGLTNKATFDKEIDQSENEENSTTENVYRPPTEEKLQQTRWTEFQKLYGHGYEIFCMTARHDGQLLATACKSTNSEHSAIILWSTNTWSEVQKLVSHKLTVTQMEFSPNDKYLLSVSRDRHWSLFKDEDGCYTLITVNSKKGLHSRIIWCCAWTKDSSYFATGSRDGKIGIWSTKMIEHNTGIFIPETVIDTGNQSVTALCFAPICNTQSTSTYVLAIGYEIGRLEIRKISMNMDNVESELIEYDTLQAHHLTVKRLKFRPINEHLSNTLQLASCSSDHSVKIHDIDLSLLNINILNMDLSLLKI